MGTGTKIAIGCGIVVLLLGGVAVVGIFFGARWFKGKAEQTAGSFRDLEAIAKQTETYARQANANAFSAPADGVIPEARLRTFLEVRKRVYAVYESNQPQIEALQKQTKDAKRLGISEAIAAGGKLARMGADIRLAQVKALAELGMNEEEYHYVQAAVYRSTLGSLSGTETGKQVPDSVAEANLALFQKYRSEIQQYAMNGLGFIGL